MGKEIKFLMFSLLVFIVSCNPNFDREVEINESKYGILDNNVKQLSSSFLDDGKLKIGFVSDIEGALDNAADSALELEQEKVDFIVIAGDNYENENIRDALYPNSTDNVDEMIKGVEPYAKLGIPIFIIPGNHETKQVYDAAIKVLQEEYANVFDIRYNDADLIGINIVGMGGYHIRGFVEENGFLLTDKDYENSKKKILEFRDQNEPTLFITHGPPLSESDIDLVSGVGNVGDEKIRDIMNSDIGEVINIHGHIHEGGRSFAEYKSGPAYNVAAITSYKNKNPANIGLLTLENRVSFVQDS